MKKYNFIDLFAGCGGLSEGFYKEDFNALAHVEIDATACKTLKTRMKYYNYENYEDAVLEMDITSENIVSKLDDVVGDKNVDLIIGGPPCQSFSTLGRARDSCGMKNDPRNFLFESYVKILNHYLPKIFVFENVTGILTQKVDGKNIIDLIINDLSENYKVKFDPDLIILNSADYGVPQVRKRVIIIGIRKDIDMDVEEIYNGILKTHYNPETEKKFRKGLKKFVTVKDAISELPFLNEGEGEKEIPFNYNRDNDFLKKITPKNFNVLRDHVCRHHNEMDVKRYKAMAKNHWTFKELLENCPELRHEKRRIFGNSYVVQWWDLPSKTIIAHLYKDGNQFIHPDYEQGRTITVREAARLQSFPDDFIFEGPRTQQFKQIGNAVPPLLSEAIAKCILNKLKIIEENN